MARTRKTREDVVVEEKIGKTNSIDRMKAEALKRGKERLNRGGSLESFNKRLEVDLPRLKELYPGWAFRWVVDHSGRIPQMKSRGYEFVPYHPDIGIGEDSVDGNSDVGGHISIVTGGKEGGTRQFLMMIPEELHEEIKKLKQKANDEVDRAIHAMKDGEGDTQVANKYTPEGGGSKYKS